MTNWETDLVKFGEKKKIKRKGTNKKYLPKQYLKDWIKEHPILTRRILASKVPEFRKCSIASQKSFMRDHPKFVNRIMKSVAKKDYDR